MLIGFRPGGAMTTPKEFAEYLIEKLKTLETELLAFRHLYEALKPTYTDLELALQTSRQWVKPQMDAKYAALSAEVSRLLDEQSVDQEKLSKLIQKWNPEGLPN
jgi:hypothetical protein